MTQKGIDLIGHFRKFGGHGNGVIIKGRVRSGKSYFTSIITKMLLDSGFAVISNLRFTNEILKTYEGRLFYITNDIGYFEAYLKIAENTPIVLVWDDAQAQEGFSSTGVMTKEGKLLSIFLSFIGKLETNFIYIAHRSYIPRSLTEGFNPLIIYKLDKYHFWIGSELYDTFTEIKRNCYKTPIPVSLKPLDFLSRGFADFSWDLPLPELFSYCSRPDIEEDLRKGISEFLAKYEKQGENRHLTDLSYSDIILALMLKRERNISSGEKIGDLVNDKQIGEARKKYRQITK